jgi:hypothetical protein
MELEKKSLSSKSSKGADWSTVQKCHPDHADFIRAITGAFGKPAFVGVKTDAGEVLMDSRRYDL